MAKPKLPAAYNDVHAGIVSLLESARHAAARSVNAIMTASYWEIGRRIVEFEQGGRGRAKYGEALIERLAEDLTHRFGRGFSRRNIEQMRQLYLAWPIAQTLSAQFKAIENPQTPSAKSSSLPIAHTPSEQSPNLAALAARFALPWSAYVRLLSVKSEAAHWMKPGENPPVGLILCADKGAAEVHYALDNLPNKVLAAEYQTVLPDEKLIADELERSRRELEARRLAKPKTRGEA